MKVTRSNQTLILASERRGQGAKPDNTLDQAVNAASKGGALRRVTIVATQSKGDQDGGVVYVQADYSDRRRASDTPASPDPDTGRTPGTLSDATKTHFAPPGTALVVTSKALTRTSIPADSVGNSMLFPGSNGRDVYGNLRSEAGGGLSAHLKPEQQYAQTQRIASSPPRSSLIDVRA